MPAAAVVAHNAAMIVEAALGVDPVDPVDVDPVVMVVPDTDPVVPDADPAVPDADLGVPDLGVPDVARVARVAQSAQVAQVSQVAQVAQVEATNLAKRIQNDGPDPKTS